MRIFSFPFRSLDTATLADKMAKILWTQKSKLYLFWCCCCCCCFILGAEREEITKIIRMSEMHNFSTILSLTRYNYESEEASRFRFDFLPKYNTAHWIPRRFDKCTMLNRVIQIDTCIDFLIYCKHAGGGWLIQIKCIVCPVAIPIELNKPINCLVILTSGTIHCRQQRCAIKCFRCQIIDVELIRYAKCGYNTGNKPQIHNNNENWPHFHEWKLFRFAWQ